MANDKQLILVVEGTAAMAPYWTTIVSQLELIIRSVCTNDSIGETSSSAAASGSTVNFALVMFNANDSAFIIHRSGWTTDVNQFFGWLSSLSFSGGELIYVATAEGLAEALMMFEIPQNGYQAQQNLDGNRHCILVSASMPCPVPTPVYRPAMIAMVQSAINGAQPENLLHNAETVSMWFWLCSVSLSVISPKQLPELKAIYYAANPNQRISEPAVAFELPPHILVQLSDGFSEARAALGRSFVSQRANMAMPKQGSQSENVKIWEGSLHEKKRKRSEFITKLEGYRNHKASETLAANWPPDMYIDHFNTQNFMDKQYVREEDVLVFRAKNRHVLLSEMQEKKLCAVIHLPSNTLLLSVTDETSHLIAKLFPGDKLVFMPQILTQVTQEHQEQQSQQQQQQQQQQLHLQQQQQQHLQQQQQQPLQQHHHHHQPLQQHHHPQPLQQHHHPQPLQQHHHPQPLQHHHHHQPLQQHHHHQPLQQHHHHHQPLQQHHHPQPLQQHHHPQLLHSMQQQMIQYQLRHQPQQPLQQHHHPQPLQQHHRPQLLHSMQQQMMQYQLRHQPSMHFEQQQQSSQPQQIVDDGMGQDHMAKKGSMDKSEPL